jgi:cysteine-S-conjugate beta-lyase
MSDPDSFGNFANRSSSKWRRFPAEVLPMHVAEMDFEVAKPIRDKLIDMVSNSDVGYLGPLPELGPAFEKFALERWGWQIEPSQIKMATDVGVAAVEILRAVTEPGDKVLISSPVYAAFFAWIKEVGCEVADAPLALEGSRWQLDLNAIEEQFREGVKVYLLCSPQNPVGTVHTARELAEVARLAKEYGVLVIADEIHAPLSWVPFTPYLTVSEAAEQTGVTITSSSKAWNTAGLKAGFAITQSDAVRLRLRKLPDAMQWRSSILGALAMVSAYQECGEWLDETVATLQENLAHLHHEVSTQLPKAKLFEMESTYLAWLDLNDYRVSNPQAVILEEGKVSVVPGQDHGGAQYQGFIRFNFATSKPRITEAVRRIASVLEGNQ